MTAQGDIARVSRGELGQENTAHAAIGVGYAQHELSAQVVASRLLARYPHVREYLRQRASQVHGQEYPDVDEALRALRWMRTTAAWVQRMQREC